MKTETKKEIKDTLNTILLCTIAIGIVVHLHSFFGKKTDNATQTIKTQNKTYNDSVRTDSIPSLSFVQEQIRQQKTR